MAYPVGVFADQDNRARLCIEVVNRSTFPITVSDIGLTLWFSRQRLALIQPIIIDGKPWPRRLKSRETVTAYFSPSVISDPRFISARRAYAKTDCGEYRYGNSKALSAYKETAIISNRGQG